jgi:hypothetical protein
LKEPTQKTQAQEALQANLVSKEQHETLTEFQHKVDQAKMNGDKWVETSPAIIKYFNRNGLGKSKYFDYQGLRICEYGKSEELQEDLDTQLGNLLYGKDEAKVNQVTETKPKVIA